MFTSDVFEDKEKLIILRIYLLMCVYCDICSHRLDAGTFGTMGVGTGFAIAAALHELCEAEKLSKKKPRKVVCIQGDSAFGFSGMEIETAARYNLPIVFIIANNNGIYNGLDESSWKEMLTDVESTARPLVIPPVSLHPANRYERMMHAFNCPGYNITTPEELHGSLKKALSETSRPSLLHVHVQSTSQRKAQVRQLFTDHMKIVIDEN